MSEVKSINILGIVAVIGALLMIIGVFLAWFQVSGYGESETISGWEVATEEGADLIFKYHYAPLVALVCGIICLIALIVPVVVQTKNIGKILGGIGLILSVVTLIVTALYYGDVGSESLLGTTLGVGGGVWVVMAGAVITIVGAILDIVWKGKRSEEPAA